MKTNEEISTFIKEIREVATLHEARRFIQAADIISELLDENTELHKALELQGKVLQDLTAIKIAAESFDAVCEEAKKTTQNEGQRWAVHSAVKDILKGIAVCRKPGGRNE